MRYYGPHIWSRLDGKVKDKPIAYNLLSPEIRRINLVDLIIDNCGSCVICSS